VLAMTTQLHCGDALEVMRGMADNSIDLIATDPPYFKVKGEWWDRQWNDAAGFIAWMGQLAEQWQRILKSNGSVYVFASPRMAARVEVSIAERFNVLNHIVWNKSGGTRANQAEKAALRAFFGNSERIIFAEHYGADNIAKGEAGYAAKCDQLRGFIFEPLRKYLDDERTRAGVAHRDIIAALGMGGHDTHFFSDVQWKLPLKHQYEQMRDIFSRLDHGGAYLTREYEDLRREYEDLRRPFSVTADVPYTDVWTFPTVSTYAGKHPCEKPLAMMKHIVSASSKAGAVVLDCFMGSGSTIQAAQELGRDAIGIDIEQKWIDFTQRRLERAQVTQPALEM
jgi:adenine-specific DNA-methyltransferase